MSTTTKKKISDFFNPITNPGGGFTTANSTPSMRTEGTRFGPLSPKLLGPIPSTLMSIYNGLKPTPQEPSPAFTPQAPATAPVVFGVGGRTPAPVAPAPGVPRGTAPAPVTPPVAPVAPTPVAPAQANVPAQYKNADGSMKTPEQVAAEIAATLKTTSGAPDIGRLSGNEFGGADKTEEQLQAEAALINNARNDIAVGETDPYKIGADSGIAYTPAELQAIEKSYAGIYDPAITTAHAKLESKQKENEFKRKVVADADAAEKEFGNDLKMLGEKHKYDLESMKLDQDFQRSMVGYKAALDAKATASGITPYSDERSQRTVQSIDELTGQVNGWTTGWGSLLSSVPNTQAKTFNSQLNTLKAAIAFGELTAMREASKTGGALGNVSNIELGLLESALAGLDSAQSPEDFKGQLTKAKDSINRWRSAQGAQPLGVAPASAEVVTTAPDGVQVIITD